MEAYRLQNTVTVSSFVGLLRKRKEVFSSLWKSANKALTQKHDVEIINHFEDTSDEMTCELSIELEMCQLPEEKMLVRAGM